MRQQFEIPIKFVSLNEYINKCKQRNGIPAQAYKHKVQEQIGWYIKRQKVKRVTRPVFITFIWYEGTKKRDIDNVAFAKKFCLDALQVYGILENDNASWVKGFADSFVYGQGQKVVVILEDADEVDKRGEIYDKQRMVE